MDTKEILTLEITALILSIVFGLLFASDKRGASRVANISVVEYPVPAMAIGAFAIAISGMMNFVASRAPANQRTVPFAACGIFALLFFFLPLEFYFRRIEFGEKGIAIRCVWRSERRIPWTNVVAFVHLPRQKEWILETKSLAKIKLSTFLQGLHDLQTEAVKHDKGA